MYVKPSASNLMSLGPNGSTCHNVTPSFKILLSLGCSNILLSPGTTLVSGGSEGKSMKSVMLFLETLSDAWHELELVVFEMEPWEATLENRVTFCMSPNGSDERS